MRNEWARTAIAGLISLAVISCGEGPTIPGLTKVAPRGASFAGVAGPKVVISQVYGGGGNSGATFQNDFVELFNAGSANATLDGWSVQYASATGTGNLGANSTQLVTLAGSLAPGQYYLIKMSGSTTGAVLPPADATNTGINMAAGAGKVALVDQATSVGCNGGSTPCTAAQAAHIIDLVGYGTGTSGATYFEGAAPAPTISATLADFRADHGCTDTNSNSADFAATTPAPRNGTTTLAPCAGATTGPLDHIAVSGPATVSVGATITLTADLQDASNQSISDPAATYDWQSSVPATAQVVSTNANTATIKGIAAGGPVTITVTSTSKSVTKSATASVTVTNATIVPSTTVVSEIHYDNVGNDVDERIEIEGDAGSSIAGWSLVLYDGNGGPMYSTTTLSGTIPATCGNRGVVVIPYPANGIQNGSPDGWALVNAQGQVTEFRSYEGTFTATDGPAAGLTSTAIDADETTAPPVGQSVQRAGNGVWFGPAANSFGTCNPATPPVHGTLNVNSGKLQLALGMQTQFFFSGTDGSGAPVTSVVWSTSNSAVITVDANGVVTGKGLGAAQLTATASDGTFGTVDMTVYLAAGSSGIRLGHNTEFGEPKDADPSDDFIIRRQQYTVSYNPNRGGANWVSWNLDASHVGDVGRCSGTCYSADTVLSKAGLPAYTTADWVSNSTYDRGHMAPSADWTSSEADNNTTFFLTNFVPQAPDLNQGPWEVLEEALRDSVSASHGSREAYIIAGGIFTNGVGLGTLRNLGKIAIPDSTYKIAVITPAGAGLNSDGTLPANTTVLAVNMPNVQGIRSADWHNYITTVGKIEKSTGYNYLALLTEAVQCKVEVRNCAPVPNVVTSSGSTTVAAGTQLVVNTSATDADGADGPWRYVIEWGDGTSFTATLAALPTAARPLARTHTYASSGSYTIKLTITDRNGAAGVQTLVVTVNP